MLCHNVWASCVFALSMANPIRAFSLSSPIASASISIWFSLRKLRPFLTSVSIWGLIPKSGAICLYRISTLGAQSLVHAARGRSSNRRCSENFKVEILKIIHKYYSDFSPTLALEKLSEQNNLAVSKETLRQWMIADRLWVPHSKRKPRVYQPSYRRDCLGELIQIDRSHHDLVWRGVPPKCDTVILGGYLDRKNTIAPTKERIRSSFLASLSLLMSWSRTWNA